MHPVAVANTAAVLLLVMTATVNAGSFGAGVRSTRCNVDPNKGEVNNPCESLYDAECGGEYCRCPVDTGVHPNLRRCVRGYNDDNNNDDVPKNNKGSQSDHSFDDLPFDYVPPGSKPAGTSQRLDVSTDVSDTVCGRSNDPCARYGAVCSSGRCICPANTIHSSTVARCDPDPSYDKSQDHEDYDNDNGDFGADDDSWFDGNSSNRLVITFQVLPPALLGLLTGIWLTRHT